MPWSGDSPGIRVSRTDSCSRLTVVTVLRAERNRVAKAQMPQRRACDPAHGQASRSGLVVLQKEVALFLESRR